MPDWLIILGFLIGVPAGQTLLDALTRDFAGRVRMKRKFRLRRE